MAGYRPSTAEPMSRAQKLFGLMAVGGGLMALFLALLDAGAFPALGAWDGKFVTAGPIMWILAGSMFLQAEQPREDARLSPRASRRWGYSYVALGFILTPLPALGDLLLEAAR
jgi:hypothetical protein